MYLYVFITWVVANLLHPLLFIISLSNKSNSAFPLFELIGECVILFCISLLVSLPSLLLAYLVIFLVSRLPIDTWSRFFTWLLLVAAIPLVNFLLLFSSLIGEESLLSVFDLVLPSIVAAVISVLVRGRYFFNLFNTITTHKI